MGRWMLPGVAILLNIFAFACVSSEGDVIGRSSQDRPSWADGLIAEEPNGFVLASFKKTEVYRLELGMKQAQAEAMASSKDLMLARLRKEIGKRAVEILGVEAMPYAGHFDQLIADIGKTFENPEARVYRTYYEEIRRENPEGVQTFYDVFVLVAMPAASFAEGLDRAAKILTKSDKESLRKLGREILASSTTDSEG